MPTKPEVIADDSDDDEDGGAAISDDDDNAWNDSDSISSWGSTQSWEESDDDESEPAAPMPSTTATQATGGQTWRRQGVQLPSLQSHLKWPIPRSMKLPPMQVKGVQGSSNDWARGRKKARRSAFRELVAPRIRKRPGLDFSRLKQFRPIAGGAAPAGDQGAGTPPGEFPLDKGGEELFVLSSNRIDYETARPIKPDMHCTHSAEDFDSAQQYVNFPLGKWADARNGTQQARRFMRRLKYHVPWLNPLCVTDLGCKLGNSTVAILDLLPEQCAVQGWDKNDDFITSAQVYGAISTMLGETPLLHFGMQSIQEYVPSVEDLVLCMDALQEMSRPGRLFHMRRILSQMEEDAVLAVLVPDACSLPYALLRETVEEQGPWNRWLETRKIEYVTGAQAFLPLEPVAEWEAAVAPYAKAFVVREAVDPYPIPRGFESVYDWMVLEMAPVLTQLDNEWGVRQAFLRRYKEKVEECLTPRFGEMGFMGIRVRCLFAVRGSTGGGDSSGSNGSPGPATPPRGGGSGPKYLLRSDSGGVGNYGGCPSATRYVALCSRGLFSGID